MQCLETHGQRRVHLLLNHEEIFTLENVFDQCQIDSPNLVPD